MTTLRGSRMGDGAVAAAGGQGNFSALDRFIKPGWLAPLWVLLAHYLMFMAIFSLGRLFLLALHYDQVALEGINHWKSLLIGLRMDTIITSMVLIIPAFALLTMPKLLARPVQLGLRIYFLLVMLVVVFIECATFPFFAEFEARPNEIFINYLEFPKEVLGNIWASQKPELFIATVLMGITGVLYWRLFAGSFSTAMATRYRWRLALLLPILVLLFIGGRGSFDRRPADISTALYSESRAANEIAKNSSYSIGHSYYRQRKYESKATQYGKMDMEEAYRLVARELDIPVGNDPQRPFLRLEPSHFKRERPKNLVIFVQESLGAQFLEAFGGDPNITPNLNRLAKEGIFFDELYSNGTRSIRGIAGSTAGIYAIPGEGVIKRPKAQRDFFTVASLLKPYGYHSNFFYGGESSFDNMRSWFYGNGFNQIIDEPFYADAKFHGVWGVSDEDLVDRALVEFKTLHEQQKPFVSVLFSTTNHIPFDYPDGRIEPLPGEPKHGVKNAVKFADYAIGRLIDKARQEPYYNDTVFVIVADHNIRVYGNDVVPVNMFHIPGLILGGGIEPMRVERLATQPDVLATALDLTGLDLTYPILGASVFKDTTKNAALMEFHGTYALRRGDKVAVIQPGGKTQTFLYREEHLHPAEDDQELERGARAFVVVLDDLYQQRRYRTF